MKFPKENYDIHGSLVVILHAAQCFLCYCCIPTTGVNNLNSGSGVSQDSMNFYTITYQMAFSLVLAGTNCQ